MKVLIAAGLTPISLPKPSPSSSSERRGEPKKLFPFKFPRDFNTSLATLSSVLCANGLAKALTYEEALSQSVTNLTSFGGSSDFDIGQFVDGIVKFSSENPLVIGGGAAVLVVPLILSQVLKEPKNWGVQNAKFAYAKLAEDVGAQLVDIREGKAIKELGSPDVKSLKKKVVAITYRGEDKPGFLKKLALKFKDPENTTLFILDKFDGNSELVAELASANGFRAAYAIKDGAEGPRGWVNSGLPWTPPKKGLTMDFTDLTDALGGSSDGVPVLGLAALTGLGIFAATEMETVLQLLGCAAIVQFVTKKLWFAEDRKTTLQQVSEFLNTKIAPKELAGDIKMIGKALLPVPISSKSFPPPTQENLETSSSVTPVLKTDSASEITPELKEVEPAINSIPNSEVSDGSLPGLSRPLSPYPNYPDSKLPSSPSPTESLIPASPILKVDSVSEGKPELKEEVVAESLPSINSIPKLEISDGSLPIPSRPLSPFPNYPDFKPPSSPSPTQA